MNEEEGNTYASAAAAGRRPRRPASLPPSPASCCSCCHTGCRSCRCAHSYSWLIVVRGSGGREAEEASAGEGHLQLAWQRSIEILACADLRRSRSAARSWPGLSAVFSTIAWSASRLRLSSAPSLASGEHSRSLGSCLARRLPMRRNWEATSSSTRCLGAQSMSSRRWWTKASL